MQNKSHIICAKSSSYIKSRGLPLLHVKGKLDPRGRFALVCREKRILIHELSRAVQKLTPYLTIPGDELCCADRRPSQRIDMKLAIL